MMRIEAARAKTGSPTCPSSPARDRRAARVRAAQRVARGRHAHQHDGVHLGIAVSLGEGGLIVPVIHDAQELSAEGLAKRIRDLAAARARQRAGPDDVRGGTFTITNPGGFGSIMATPVINQPQVAILDLEAVVKRPVVITDERERRDRHPPDDVPVHVLGPPRARRRAGGAVPERAKKLEPGRLVGQVWRTPAPGLRGRGGPTTIECDRTGAVGLPPRPRRVPRGARPPGARARARQAGALPDMLLLLEHPPVYTRGRRSEPGELPSATTSTWSTSTAAASSPTTARASSSAIRSCASTTSSARRDDGARDGRRAREAGVPRERARAPTTPASGWASARSPRSASTSRAASRRTASRSTSTTTSPVRLGRRLRAAGVRMTSLREEGASEGDRCFRRRVAHAFAQAFGRRQRLVTPRRLGAHEPIAV